MRDETIGDYLDRLADRVPAPGGGAAAALHAAQAAALLGMVAAYTTGAKYAEHAPIVESVLATTRAQRERALDLAEADADAFSAVAAAYALPRESPEAKVSRSAALAAALAGAARPPADVIGVAAGLLEVAQGLMPVANRNVITDIAAAAEALRAAAATARVNIEVNLRGISDEAARTELTSIAARVEAIVDGADAVTAAVRKEIS